MRLILTFAIVVSIFLPATDANAFFGRRRARVMCGGRGCGPAPRMSCGGGGCRPPGGLIQDEGSFGGGGRCGSGGCSPGGNFSDQIGGGFQRDFFSQPQFGSRDLGSFGSGSSGLGGVNGGIGNIGGGNGSLIDPSTGAVIGAGNTGAIGTGSDPFQNLGPVRTLTSNGIFREDGIQVSTGPIPQCRLFKQDQFGRRTFIDPRNEIAIFKHYQNKESQGIALNQTQRCILDFYRRTFPNSPFFGRDNNVPGTGGANGGGVNSGAHGGTVPTQPGRPTAPKPETVFTKWRGDFNSDNSARATDGHILASTASSPSENNKFNFMVVEQDCVSKADPDTKIPTTMILFNSKDKEGKDQSHIAFIPGGLKEEDKKKEVEAAWKRVTADPNEAGGGKLRNVEADPSAFYTTFKVNGLLEYPETQVQLKKIFKNGQEQFITRYVHKHGSTLSDGRWKLNEKDAPYYCENRNQPAPKPADTSKPPEKTETGSTSREAVAAKAKAIFAQNCFSCHGPDDGMDTVFDKDGNMVSGNPAAILARVTLPQDSSRRMPKKPKGPLSAEQIASIREWSEVAKQK